MSIPKACRAYVLEHSGEPGSLKEIPVPLPKHGEVLIKVHACGVCSGDAVIMSGALGSMVSYPLIPGNEIVGTIVAVGAEEKRWKVGDLVGGGYHGGHDGTCKSCNSGFYQTCENQIVNGITKVGGCKYAAVNGLDDANMSDAEYTVLRSEATVRLPSHMDKASMAPLMFNGIRQMNIKQGGLIAVQGLGGLGHLGVQYARKMGYQTVAISSSGKKETFAKKLGAIVYINTSMEDPVEQLQKMGGADLIAVTAPDAQLISSLVNALAPQGKLLILSGKLSSLT
jgi:D-arabinose 1-dehydrogenase-like Zn-dependent alcohol dehydrogenase